MAWFPVNRQRFNALDYPQNLVYCVVMSRINYGEAAIQLGCVCLDGQCVMTTAMLASATGVSHKTVGRSLKRLGFSVETVASREVNGGYVLRITVPIMMRRDVQTPGQTPVHTSSNSKPVGAEGVAKEIKTGVSRPLSIPESPLVLEKRYDKTAIGVASATGTSPTPGLQAEVVALAALYTGDEILGAVKNQLLVEGPRTSVPGWIRTVVSRVLKENKKDANLPERKKPAPLPPPASPAVTSAGIAQFKEALKNAVTKKNVPE